MEIGPYYFKDVSELLKSILGLSAGSFGIFGIGFILAVIGFIFYEKSRDRLQTERHHEVVQLLTEMINRSMAGGDGAAGGGFGKLPANTPEAELQKFHYPDYETDRGANDPNAASWASYYKEYRQQQGAGVTSNYAVSAEQAGQPAQAAAVSGSPDLLSVLVDIQRLLVELQAQANQQGGATASQAHAALVAQNYAYGQQLSQYGFGRNIPTAPAQTLINMRQLSV